jgi:hypothetical protein
LIKWTVYEEPSCIKFQDAKNVSADSVGINPIQLPQAFVRGLRSRKSFQFLIKWTGYEEPSCIKFQDAKKLAQFPGYVSLYSGLQML